MTSLPLNKALTDKEGNMPSDICVNKIIRSSLLSEHNVTHGFSTKELGNMSLDRSQKGRAAANQEAFFKKLGIDLNNAAVFMPPVQHTAGIAILLKKETSKGKIHLTVKSPEIVILEKDKDRNAFDSCIANGSHSYLAILPADCAPVMFFDEITGWYGLIHVGAVGLAKNILVKTFAFLKKHCNLEADRLGCYIGPCICDDCYSHGVDLKGLITTQLLGLGVKQDKLEASQFCTAHDEKLFFSHHRAKKRGQDQNEGRNMAIIGLKQ